MSKSDADKPVPVEELKKITKGLGKKVQIALDPREWEDQQK